MNQNLKSADIHVGQTLPERPIPVTSSLVTCGALATRDFEKVHHDKTFAQASGMPDVYMNILTSQGLTETYLRDWVGRDAVFRKLSVRLGAPNIPGTTMTMSGAVKSVQGTTLEVEVIGQNDKWGLHVKALATLELTG